MTESEALRQAGWRVLEAQTVTRVKPPEATDGPWIDVARNPDGTLHLVKARSFFHRRIAAALGQATPSMPGGML